VEPTPAVFRDLASSGFVGLLNEHRIPKRGTREKIQYRTRKHALINSSRVTICTKNRSFIIRCCGLRESARPRFVSLHGLAHAEKEGIGWKDSSLQEMRGSFGGEQGTCIGSVVFLVTYCFDVTSMSVK
jgi:hypothetical protein